MGKWICLFVVALAVASTGPVVAESDEEMLERARILSSQTNLPPAPNDPTPPVNQNTTVSPEAFPADQPATLPQSNQAAMEATIRQVRMKMGIMLILLVGLVISVGIVFERAGRPGWAVVVPIYNLYVELQIAGRPGWWLLLMFIPGVNLIIRFVVGIDIARNFGKSFIWGLVFALLPFIFYPWLVISRAQFQGPKPSHLG